MSRWIVYGPTDAWTNDGRTNGRRRLQQNVDLSKEILQLKIRMPKIKQKYQFTSMTVQKEKILLSYKTKSAQKTLEKQA